MKLTESRCKILGMELDRPLWETAKQQRERVEKGEGEEAMREATRDELSLGMLSVLSRLLN